MNNTDYRSLGAFYMVVTAGGSELARTRCLRKFNSSLSTATVDQTDLIEERLKAHTLTSYVERIRRIYR